LKASFRTKKFCGHSFLSIYYSYVPYFQCGKKPALDIGVLLGKSVNEMPGKFSLSESPITLNVKGCNFVTSGVVPFPGNKGQGQTLDF